MKVTKTKQRQTGKRAPLQLTELVKVEAKRLSAPFGIARE
jgi:hypothetical protein